MKTLYLECNMGAAGDMLTAALLELFPDPQALVERLNGLGLPGIVTSAHKDVKCGITGTRIRVLVHGQEEGCGGEAEHGQKHAEHVHEQMEGVQEEHHLEQEEHSHAHAEHEQEELSHEQKHTEHGHHHHHSSLHDVEQIVFGLSLPEPVKEDVLAVYGLIAEAESAAHDRPVTEIHFHEVGTLDAIADVAAVCLLIHELHPDRIAASPVHVGSGHVHCAHGILPVPAPATAWLLRGIPTYGGQIQGELCTPTGAALLKHFVTEFGVQPVMRVEKIGYGMGKKDFEMANCVRAMLGETEDRADQVAELFCNLDDMTPEDIAFAAEELFAAGALDVTTTAIGMKKGRPGVLLSCMCRLNQREEMLRLIFKHTTTLGVRETLSRRYTLNRTLEQRETAYGSVTVKKASGWGVTREKTEYEDRARIAREQGLSLREVF